MNNKYEPCSICEGYMEGVICDNDECPVAKMKAEIERLKSMNQAKLDMIHDIRADLETAKSEAIKEFAERLKKEADGYNLCGDGVIYQIVDVDDIDYLVKEMTEDV